MFSGNNGNTAVNPSEDPLTRRLVFSRASLGMLRESLGVGSSVATSSSFPTQHSPQPPLPPSSYTVYPGHGTSMRNHRGGTASSQFSDTSSSSNASSSSSFFNHLLSSSPYSLSAPPSSTSSMPSRRSATTHQQQMDLLDALSAAQTAAAAAAATANVTHISTNSVHAPAPLISVRQSHQNISNSNNNVHPSFRSKIVCKLDCKFCLQPICNRGMKAILLADTRVELYSTDSVPARRVQLVAEDYLTRNCNCRIRDVACLGCGNVIGYHVTQPCDVCMSACNNGHFWMFHDDAITSQERMDRHTKRLLMWSQLPHAEQDVEMVERVGLVCR